MLAIAGDGYTIGTPWRERESDYGTDQLVEAVVRASRTVARQAPGGMAAIGDLSRRGGGGSIEHRSHQSGRDVDVFFYAVNVAGRPMPPGGVMMHFDRLGRAVRWSPPKGAVAPKRPVPDARFDVRRNWAFIRALLQDPEVEVQWIFAQRDLTTRLLQQSVAEGDDPALRARAAQIVRQPSDSEVHDDHMHIRIYCDPSDRAVGCSDRGPARWWKKGWKYMEPPFGRGDEAAVASALAGLLRGRVPVSVGRAGSAS
jgi:penicillin-insensitive murein endopeptidase